MEYKVTEESFLKDVADHYMTILRDEGLYRHVAFKKPGTSDMRFDIITWPMHLCYTGDMGTYVFQRTTDMFTFFRPGSRDMKINPDYWSQKLEAIDRSDGLKEFSLHKFRTAVIDLLNSHEASEQLRSDAEELLTEDFGNEYEAREAVREFEDNHPDDNLFTDFWETDVTRYVGRFIWCCYAIVWGLAQYDRLNSTQPPDECHPVVRTEHLVKHLLSLLVHEWPSGGWVANLPASGLEFPGGTEYGKGQYYFKDHQAAIDAVMNYKEPANGKATTKA